MKSAFGRRLVVWFGVLSSALFGWLAFRSFSLPELLATLGRADAGLLLLGAGCLVATFTLRAWRWRCFLPENQHPAFGGLWSALVLGYFFSNFLPARLGDLIRPAYLARSSDVSFRISLYSVVMERLWDLVCIVVMGLGLIGLVGAGRFDALLAHAPLLWGGVAAGVAFLLFARAILRLGAGVLDWVGVSFASRFVREIVEAFAVRPSRRQVAGRVALTVCVLFMEGMTLWFVLEALQLGLAFWDVFIVMFVTVLSFLLPSAPAGVGVYHYFFMMSLVWCGVPGGAALSAAVFFHATIVLLDTLLGFAVLWLGPLDWRTFYGQVKGMEQSAEVAT